VLRLTGSAIASEQPPEAGHSVANHTARARIQSWARAGRLGQLGPEGLANSPSQDSEQIQIKLPVQLVTDLPTLTL
jgi:hypothetical protein